jgi:hypothetical protein
MEFLDELRPATGVVEFVDGPRAGERTTLPDQPPLIGTATGRYRRSVHCADDGALRYVWEPTPGR